MHRISGQSIFVRGKSLWQRTKRIEIPIDSNAARIRVARVEAASRPVAAAGEGKAVVAVVVIRAAASAELSGGKVERAATNQSRALLRQYFK